VAATPKCGVKNALDLEISCERTRFGIDMNTFWSRLLAEGPELGEAGGAK
jgi:hypothetical protein